MQMRCTKATLKRQKSMSSQAASISAWCTVFDWPSMVAALMLVAPRAGQQVGGAQEPDGRALIEGQLQPGRCGGPSGLDGGDGVAVVGAATGPEEQTVLVRRVHLEGLPAEFMEKARQAQMPGRRFKSRKRVK